MKMCNARNLRASLLSLLCVTVPSLMVGKNYSPTVQGIPYLNTLPSDQDMKKTGSILKDFSMPEPGTSGGDVKNFSIDDVKNWSGEGSKRAVLLIQWNTGSDNYALAFGYRFDGRPTGIDMLRCVVENNPQLYGLFQRTNVSSGSEKFGYTINGIGWDTNCSGLPVSIIDTGNNDEVYSSYSGFFEHPRGCSESNSYPDYDYDNWKAADPADYWQAGWYQGYWSYWLKDGDGSFSYSGVGASGRYLEDGSWDGWNFQPGMQMYDWKPVIAVPSLVPEGFTEIFEIDGITYQLKDKNSAQVIAGKTPYSGEIVIPATVTDSDGTFNVSSIGSSAFAGANVTSVTLPASIGTIHKKAFAGSLISGIVLPENLSSLKDSVFYGCSRLASVNFPANLSEIPAGAFASTALTTLDFTETVTTIQPAAFKDCSSLTEISLPTTLQQLSSESFAGCGALSKIKVSSTLPINIPDDVFSASTYAEAELIVPEGFTESYAEATGWRNFVKISTHRLPVNVGDRFLSNGVPMRVTSVNPNTVTVTYNHFEGSFRETAVQTANRKLSGEMIVPAQITYMGQTFDVTEIQPYSFYGANAVTRIVLPENITGFGPHVFDGCSKVTSITLPKKVQNIPDYAFSGCSALAEIVNLPEKVDTIGGSAFNQCSKLTEMPLIKEGLKVIGNSAFFNSGLTSIQIPASVDSIGYQALANTKITTVSIPSTVTKWGAQAFYQCRSLTSASIASGFSVIPDGLFYNCRELTSIAIPEGVTRIGSNAFYGCSKMAEALIPGTVEEISTAAFSGTSKLTSITLPEKLKVIGDQAFYNCKLTSLTIPAAVDSIGKNAFYGGAFTEVTYPANVNRTGGYTFANCTSLTRVNFPDDLSAIPDGLFKGCTKLTQISIPDACRKIGFETFSGCSVLNIAIPSQIERIGENAFYNCKALQRAEIPSSVTAIPKNLFNGCSSLTEVIFAPGTTSIGDNAFYGCSSLEHITLPSTLTSIGSSIFYGCSRLKEVTIPEGFTSVPAGIFYNCSALARVNLPQTVTEVGQYAFRGCKALVSLALPEGITMIGARAFQDCSALTEFTMPKGVTVVPDYIFSGCTSLENIHFAEGTTEISNSAFYNCKALTTLVIPATVKTIGQSAFSGCTNLVPVLHEGLETISSYAFSKCEKITEFKLPSTVTQIGGSAYQGCTGLPTVIEIPPQITSIGGAMIQDTNVETVYVCDPVKAAAADYTFRTVSSWSNPVFADVIVPFGYSSEVASFTGYAKAKSLTEPELENVEISSTTAIPAKETAALAANIAAAFPDELSDSFRKACSSGFNKTARVEIVYTFLRTIADDETSDSPAEAIAYAADENIAEATATEDGTFISNLEGLKPQSVYSYKWRVSAGDRVVESPIQEFTTLNTTGIDVVIPDMIDASAPVEIYSLSGERIGRFASISDAGLTGIFIVRQDNKIVKAIIR